MLRGTESDHLPLPKLMASWMSTSFNTYCHEHRGPNGEAPPPELLVYNQQCGNVIFCGSISESRFCTGALNCEYLGPADCGAAVSFIKSFVRQDYQ